MNNEYKRCEFCVMDNETDKSIQFDEHGECDYCRSARKELNEHYHPDATGTKLFENMVDKMKADGKGKRYDCLMGVSGGLDSSYLLYQCAQKGLRILAIHIDDGFDTELAKTNIRKLTQKSGIELVTITPDAAQFNDITVAYMKAGVCNLAVPQDNVLFACIYRYAKNNNIHYFLSGSNLALESILERGERYPAHDTVNIRCIHRRFGKGSIDNLELLSYGEKLLMSKLFRLQTLRPLNYIDYNRVRAISELHTYCGYEYYKAKHLENELTKFIQLYWFNEKFTIDKRKSHLSSMIVSGQITRVEALAELDKPVYDEQDMKCTIELLIAKLGITHHEFDEIIAAPTHSHYDYRTSFLYNTLRNVKHIIK